jgi:hypothetical protein
MPDWGFGSPDTLAGDNDPPFDHGFGSPVPDTFDPATEAEAGFGSPVELIDPGLLALAATVDIKQPVVSDDGGDIITLFADWTTVGPYRVRLHAVNGDTFPDVGFAYSGVPGQGNVVFANAALDLLEFVMPPAPPGKYIVRLEFGPNFTQSVDVVEELLVMRRNRSAATYRMRRKTPDTTGPVHHETEPRFLGGFEP